MAYDGNTFFDVHTRQFSVEDLGQIFFPDTMLKLGNWIQAGYIKPDYFKDPRGGRDRRRFSIVEIARIALIDTLVNGIGIKPSLAAEIADYAVPFLNETFVRDAAQERVSNARVYIISCLRREDGKMQSLTLYRKPEDPAWYTDNPDLNPDAKPHAPPKGAVILYPLSDAFNTVFLSAAALLAKQKRGGMDKFRRPIDADA
jgi:hypothetical protein